MPRTITIPDDLDRRITEHAAATAALSDAEDNGTADPDDWAANEDENRDILNEIIALFDNLQESRP
ncbi:hypothetical protein [Corynebacterium kalidii]